MATWRGLFYKEERSIKFQYSDKSQPLVRSTPNTFSSRPTGQHWDKNPQNVDCLAAKALWSSCKPCLTSSSVNKCLTSSSVWPQQSRPPKCCETVKRDRGCRAKVTCESHSSVPRILYISAAFPNIGDSNKSCGKVGNNSNIRQPSERDTLMGIVTDALPPRAQEGHVYQVRMTSTDKCTEKHDLYRQHKVKHLQLSIRYTGTLHLV